MIDYKTLNNQPSYQPDHQPKNSKVYYKNNITKKGL